jgi:hypothetical protein
VNEPPNRPPIIINSTDLAWKIRCRPLYFALISPLVCSWPTFFLIHAVDRSNGALATLAVAMVGLAAAVFGFSVRLFGAQRPSLLAFEFVASIAVGSAVYTGAVTHNGSAGVVVGGMMLGVGMIASEFVTNFALPEFEREALEAIRRRDLNMTRRFFGKEDAARVRVVDPASRPLRPGEVGDD